ncbi:MAG: Nicotinamide-nucleotide adenylyltransferase [Candidatus Methanofastidiosum methylothiophilum]|uniref:Nicotinamide-nucleotide adenylyltransferase n=1 Tax=Candidatus Methanofastidiosum methylothiophilum TaxID=1705564 RepID=A0A150IVC3_9EURY|nr:MAG: Nicotinamide-nucleotide adenylyltransferase [Candidatus Methanofastidiosum methylthiophilus]NMC76758.1 nicotinamide-nucleotide adenylyltransferase [Candidatus Methanofastidiosa archaeon]
MKRALFIGRFQPFHNGHYHAIKEILKKEDELIVCVAASQFSYTINNPFSCGERIEMILRSIKNLRNKVIILSSQNIDSNILWVENIIETFPKFETVYSNNKLVKLLWEKRGYEVAEVSFFEKEELNGTYIRKLISKGENWENKVPKETKEYIKEIYGERRIKEIQEVEEKLRNGAI